jgi:hypothetical protein
MVGPASTTVRFERLVFTPVRILKKAGPATQGRSDRPARARAPGGSGRPACAQLVETGILTPKRFTIF